MTQLQPLISQVGLQKEIMDILNRDNISTHNVRVLAERLMQGYLNLHERIELHGPSGEWSALYVDGKLIRVGDTPNVEETLYEILRIKQVWGDDFMRGQTARAGVANTPQEALEYRRDREARDAQAQSLLTQAEALVAQAKALRAGVAS
jgi:hypothetical protein